MLRQGIQGISELITVPGLINLDFNDVKTIMSEGGSALMAIGRGSGENRAVTGSAAGDHQPLLEIQSIDGAKGILYNVTGGVDLMMGEIDEAAQVIARAADPDAMIIFGAVIDPRVQGEMRITVIATGFNGKQQASVLEKVRPLRVANLPYIADSDVEIPPFLRRGKTGRGNETGNG